MPVVVIETLCPANPLDKALYQETLVKSLNMGDMREARQSQQTKKTLRILVQVNLTMRKEVIYLYQRSI